jgi:hypothetical protein
MMRTSSRDVMDDGRIIGDDGRIIGDDEDNMIIGGH